MLDNVNHTEFSSTSAEQVHKHALERYQDLCEFFDNDPDAIKGILENGTEFRNWLERMRWHVEECEKLARELDAEKKANPAEKTFIEKREWIEGYRDRLYRRKLYCPFCGIRIRTESWDKKRCFGYYTILNDNEMPNFCPNCGMSLKEVTYDQLEEN